MTNTATAKTATCTRCKATLRSEASVKRGMGPTCARLARQEKAATALARQFAGADVIRTKALQILTDKGMVPTRHDSQYLAVASTGDAAYLVDTVGRTCTCKGHQRVGRCYHLVAADVMEITTARRSAYALAA